MKVLLLAGGFGSRLSEYTDLVPKPMVTIGNKPILMHIMSWYASYGFKDFVVALGYKSDYVKSYFHGLRVSSPDATIDFNSNHVTYLAPSFLDWKVTLLDTGINTMTGGRIKRCQPIIGDNPFMITYGDGLSNINLRDLTAFHRNSKSTLTLTAVRPLARFGNLEFSDSDTLVSSFSEKPQISTGWINGGYFVAQPEIFDYLTDDQCIFERAPLQALASCGQLSAYKHTGFWQCMDTKRDRDSLEELYRAPNPPWVPTA